MDLLDKWNMNIKTKKKRIFRKINYLGSMTLHLLKKKCIGRLVELKFTLL